MHKGKRQKLLVNNYSQQLSIVIEYWHDKCWYPDSILIATRKKQSSPSTVQVNDSSSFLSTLNSADNVGSDSVIFTFELLECIVIVVSVV